jgi:signal transduction histidine kinase
MTSDQSGAPTRLETVAAWRVQLLDRVFTYMFALLAGLLALESLASLRSGQWHALPSLAFGVALQGVAAFARSWSPRLRSVIFTAAAWLAMGTTMPKLGFAFPVPFIVACLTFTILALCVGQRFAVGSLLVLVVILLADAYYISFLKTPPAGQVLAPGILEPRRFGNWIRVISAFAAVALAIIASVGFLIRRLETAVEHNGQLFGRLEDSSRVANTALDDLRLAYTQLAQLNRMLDTAREEERRFMAHELHDELGQMLTALKLRMQLTAREPTAPAAGPALELIDQLIRRVRKMSGDLRPPLLDEVGLLPALRAYFENNEALFSVPIDLDMSEPPAAPRLAPDLEIACFRVIQESLTNALRHASPARIQVGVRRDDDQIAVSVRDDGKGFDTGGLQEKASAGHLGVLGMRERVRARGGTFDLVSRPGAGTAVEARFPVALAPEASQPSGPGPNV